MAKRQKCLTKKQCDVIDDLFRSDLTEEEVLAEHGVSKSVYRRWLRDKVFHDEITFRIEAGKRLGELIIAVNAPIAASKLAKIANGKDGETTRKACLDIISTSLGTKKRQKADKGEPLKVPKLSDELVSKLLETAATL
jgi:hypothetical protein